MKFKKGKNILLQLVLMPFLVCNVIFPKNISLEIDYSTLADLLKSQSTIFEYSSFAVLPLKIVQELFDQHGLAKTSSKESRKEDKKQSNTSNDLFTFSVFKTVKKDSCFKKNWQNSLNYHIKSYFSGVENNYKRFDEHSSGGLGIFLLILICILLLPRGSIEDYCMSLICRFENTAKRLFGRVFFIYPVRGKGERSLIFRYGFMLLAINFKRISYYLTTSPNSLNNLSLWQVFSNRKNNLIRRYHGI
ncbi:MAG: hypothetical protein NT145_05860 [Elusimicrobia bacterium]|nr:hypothetical protein [Elusimicrobiota bacterium]